MCVCPSCVSLSVRLCVLCVATNFRFGDGIMSAIDFYCTVDKMEGTQGERRVVITFNGERRVRYKDRAHKSELDCHAQGLHWLCFEVVAVTNNEPRYALAQTRTLCLVPTLPRCMCSAILAVRVCVLCRQVPAVCGAANHRQCCTAAAAAAGDKAVTLWCVL